MPHVTRATWTAPSVILLSSLVASYPGLLLADRLFPRNEAAGTALIAALCASVATLVGSFALNRRPIWRVGAALAGGTAAYSLGSMVAFGLSVLLPSFSIAAGGAAVGYLLGASTERLLARLIRGSDDVEHPRRPLRWPLAAAGACGALLWVVSLYCAAGRGAIQWDNLLWLALPTCALMQAVVVSLLLGFPQRSRGLSEELREH